MHNLTCVHSPCVQNRPHDCARLQYRVHRHSVSASLHALTGPHARPGGPGLTHTPTQSARAGPACSRPRPRRPAHARTSSDDGQCRRRPPVRGATPTRPPVRGATPARTPRLSYRHPRVPGRPRGGVVEQRERRTADSAALPAVHRSDVHPPPPPPRPRPPRPSAKRAPGRRSARSEQPPPAPAGACAPSGVADRSTRRRRAVRTPMAARAAARPAARKQARCSKRVDGMPPNGTVRAACETGLPACTARRRRAEWRQGTA